MLIEIYKGVVINHDVVKDIFTTNLVVLSKKTANVYNSSQKNSYVSSPRLQATRDEIDRVLNASTTKPLLKKGWYRYSDNSDFEAVTIVYYNLLSKKAQIKKADGTTKDIGLGNNNYGGEGKLYIDSKENNALIANIIKVEKEIKDLKKKISCSRLIPLTEEHFTSISGSK